MLIDSRVEVEVEVGIMISKTKKTILFNRTTRLLIKGNYCGKRRKGPINIKYKRWMLMMNRSRSS